MKTAFLNGELTEEVFMKQPERFIQQGKENLVCGLNRSKHIYTISSETKLTKQQLMFNTVEAVT